MNDDLLFSIEFLRTASSALNELSDRAAQTVEEVEKFLQELNVGISGRVTYHEVDRVLRCLEYRRVGDEFRIAVTKYVVPDLIPKDIKAWSDCNRQVKMASLPKLAELIVEIARKLQEQIATTETAVGGALSVLAALRQKEGA